MSMAATVRRAALGLGANLGDAAAALQGAVDVLAATDGVRVIAVSPVYETAPVGGPDQPRYLNAVVIVETALAPVALLAAAHRAEQAFGRTRDVRWGPRTLDVDVLAIDGVASDDPVLTLPHPRAHERAFVLVPWAQVDPTAMVGALGRVEVLLAALDDGDVADVARRDYLVLRVVEAAR